MLYASELTWNGGKEVEKEYQLAINRMGQASLGAFRSTPRGIVAAESGFTPARALLNHRRARFAQRLCQTQEPGTRGDPDERGDGHERVLVVRQRRAPVAAPPLHQVPGVGPAGQEDVEGDREGV
jgi:hypothetical protein